ncbi:MAG: EAL domain-containing protein [Hyphomicrobiales bacterium]|nr:EAL domain-containing protein [Hyphomicrobiales bacterium]
MDGCDQGETPSIAPAGESDLLAALLEAIEAIPDGFVLYDADDRMLLCNRAFRDFNREVGDALRPGVRFADILDLKARAARSRAKGRAEAGRAHCGVDCGPICVDWVDCRGRVHERPHGVMFETTSDGRWVRIDEHRSAGGLTVGLRTDLSDLREMQRQLAGSEAKFRTLFAMAPVGIARLRADGRIVDANPAFAVITGTSPDDESPFAELFDPRDRDDVARDFERAFAEGQFGPVERRLVGMDGGEVVLSMEGMRTVGDDGVAHVWTILQDVTDRRRGEAEIRHAAHHDALTGLPNRKRLGEVLAELGERDETTALLLLDLDNFKAVNDTFGHEAGDLVLIETARRLEAGVRDGDFVARLGGDEFAAVLAGPIEEAEAAALARRLVERLGRHVVRGGRTIRVGASAGVAVTPAHGRAGDEILRAADHALLAAKRAGRNRATVFAAPLVSAHRHRVELRDTIGWALDEDRIFPHYQPIVDLATGAIVGFEALCRIMGGGGDAAPPAEIFRESDVGRAIDARMIDRVIADVAAWRAAGFDVGRVDVNVCGADFAEETFEDDFLARLAAAGLPTSAVGLEVTETTLFDAAPAGTAKRLRRLRDQGVSIALDDFGTGHASLVHLKSLTFDRVKIDRSFVADVVFDATSRLVVETLARLGHGLGKDVVAEGVETAGQRQALIELGCRLGQGWLFARPMAATAVVERLAEPFVPASALGNRARVLR